MDISRGLLVHIAAGPRHGSGRVHKSWVRAGVRGLVGLAGVGGGDHSTGLGRVLLEADVGDVGGVALQRKEVVAGC